jgi:hypothetical protein
VGQFTEHITGNFTIFVIQSSYLNNSETCLAVAKEEKVLERGALSVTGRFFVITSRVSQSLPSAVWLAEVV